MTARLHQTPPSPGIAVSSVTLVLLVSLNGLVGGDIYCGIVESKQCSDRTTSPGGCKIRACDYNQKEDEYECKVGSPISVATDKEYDDFSETSSFPDEYERSSTEYVDCITVETCDTDGECTEGDGAPKCKRKGDPTIDPTERFYEYTKVMDGCLHIAPPQDGNEGDGGTQGNGL